MAPMGGLWHEGNQTQTVINQGVGHVVTSKSPPSHQKRGKGGHPGRKLCPSSRETFGVLLWSNCRSGLSFFRGIHEPFPFRWYCRTAWIAGRGFCGEPSCDAVFDPV